MQPNGIIQKRKLVIGWLIACLMLVAGMVVIGGLTRLTESGLSIVEWKPITGTLPPLSNDAWMQEFAAYQQSPQYRDVNYGMSLADFQGIFWLEYLHRLLGRLVGLVFFLPFLFFLAKGCLSRPFAWRMAGIFVLGGLQGVLGWYMVKSGLVDDPRVSPLRLAAHLSLAFALFAALLWTILQLANPLDTEAPRHPLSRLLVIGVFIQALLGALVAGMDAGLIYNSFPTMDGYWMPPETWALEPWLHNLWENPVTAQFVHRACAVVLVLLTMSTVLFVPHDRLGRLGTTARYGLIVTLALQLTLGVLTVLHGVPIALASAHQAAALLLLANAICLHFDSGRGKAALTTSPISSLTTAAI